MRIILPKSEIQGNRVTISGEKAKYLISVLRCEIENELQILDGEGNFYKAKIISIANKKVVAEILEKSLVSTESPLHLILIQGILKGEKMDFVMQKTTELGVKEIIPAITERSQVRHTRKVARWRKIAEEAARQSGRTVIPVIHEPVELSAILETKGLGEGETRRHGEMKGFIFWEGNGFPLKEAIASSPLPPFPASPIHVLIGPEGGFTKEEIELANAKGLIAVSLGKRILRAETAALSAVTLIQFLMGDIN